MTERCRLVGAAIAAGIPPEKAKPFASAVAADLEDTVDAKLVNFRHELRADFRNDMREQTKELRSEIGSLRRWRITAVIAGIAALAAILALAFDVVRWWLAS